MYEMLAQREPFRGRVVKETFDNIVKETPMRPSEAAPHRYIPDRLEKICLKAMEKKPADRYQSMQLMLNDIEAFLNDALKPGTS